MNGSYVYDYIGEFKYVFAFQSHSTACHRLRAYLLEMTSVILARLASICKQMSNYIKTNSPFVIEVLMVSLCFGAIISRYLILT